MICDELKKCMDEQFAERIISRCANGNFDVCIESSDKRSKVKCEEKKKKYVLENTMKSHIISYKMDGGIIRLDKTVPEGTCKCDYLYLVNGVERNAILIELKGVDVLHALKQIHGTLTLYKDFLREFSHVYGRVVVTSSVPNLKANPAYVNLVRLIRETYHGNIKINERDFEEADIQLSQP
jgi:hypothetical protein